MLGISIGDILCTIAIVLTTWPLPKNLPFEDPFFYGARLGNAQTCQAQGFLLMFGLGIAFGYNVSLFLYNTCVIAFQMKEERIVKRVEPIFHLVPLAHALQAAVPPIFYQLYNPNLLYPMCIISPTEQNQNTKEFKNESVKALIVFFILLITIVICIVLIVWRVLKLELSLVCPKILLRSQSFGGKLKKSLRNTKIIAISALAYLFAYILSAGTIAL